MIRAYYLSALFLLALVAAATAHYLLTDREGRQRSVERVAALTGLASPALGVAWYEPRLRRFEAAFNPAYPELLPPERQGFVYGDLHGK
jgi:formate-dependent nitrite reductase membrane component NrfD